MIADTKEKEKEIKRRNKMLVRTVVLTVDLLYTN